MKTIWERVKAEPIGTVLLIAMLSVGAFAVVKFRPDPLPPEPQPDAPLVVPGPNVERKVEAGRLVVLDAKAKGPVTWVVPPSLANALDLYPVGDAAAHLVVRGDGLFVVGATAVDAGKVAPVTWITIKCGKPVPPVPPTPPDPPKPPTPPDDALAKAIKDAYVKESGDKRNMAHVLGSLYRKMAEQPFTEKTVGQVFQTFVKARQSLIGEALPLVRAAVGNELDKLLPTEFDAPLTEPTQQIIRREFKRAATVLEALQ